MVDVSRGFAHDGHVVTVTAPEDDVRWLAEFAAPWFDMRPPDRDGVRISFGQGAALRPGGPPREELVAFALDAQPVRLPAWTVSGGSRLVDEGAEMSFDVSADGRSVRIEYRGSRSSARIRLMRVVREYAHNHAVGSGSLVLHAAGVVLGGSVLAIAGNKGVGKTTLAMRLLEEPGVGLLSNDRLTVQPGDEARVLGVPTIISVRPGARAFFPEVAARLQICGDFREHEGERSARGPSPPDSRDETWFVAPHQLCAAMNRAAKADGVLRALLFLREQGVRTEPLRRLDRPDAAAAIHRTMLGAGNRQPISAVFRLGGTACPSESAVRSACEALAARVPCFSGGPFAASSETAHQLLQECLGFRP
jgi:hypothetical protein